MEIIVDYATNEQVIFVQNGDAVEANFYELNQGKRGPVLKTLQATDIIVRVQSAASRANDHDLKVAHQDSRLLSSFSPAIQVEIVKTIKMHEKNGGPEYRWVTVQKDYDHFPNKILGMKIKDPRKYKAIKTIEANSTENVGRPIIIRTVEYKKHFEFQCHKEEKGLFFHFYDLRDGGIKPIGIINSLTVAVELDSEVEQKNRKFLGLVEKRDLVRLFDFERGVQEDIVISIKNDSEHDGARWVVVPDETPVKEMRITDVRTYA